jgi:hypothetical protein
MCFNTFMENDPQGNVDVPADDELSDEMLADVSGGRIRATDKDGLDRG